MPTTGFQNVTDQKWLIQTYTDVIMADGYHSIVGCLSYLVNMTRPDLAFIYSHLSKFVQYPGMVHLEAAERLVQYVRAAYDHGISYYDLGPDKRNKLGGWVDRDFASDIDSRKSMTGSLMSLNGGPISWKSSRQGGVTLSSSVTEFVAASQAGQEVVYLRDCSEVLGTLKGARLKYGKITRRAL